MGRINRLINPAHKKVFDRIFDTLQTGLSKLGDSSGSQTKAISDLIQLIKDIPMNGRQGYDVVGFIYEYLIGMFAANAGKKAGEFYTPHEVSVLMSEIIANHLKDRNEIKIYDPTSGSGSLLINIGQAVAKHISAKSPIKYYAQELKANTYNLTRMNLVMRGISADNIVTRNADTLEDDWPFFEENDPIGTYDPLHVDAVVSNPPYSQVWDTTNKETDPRYANFGVAPKSKADFAFLLHDLYHVKSDGIMTIVLPHGVLFRGGEEGNIRRNLVEGHHIDAIIGLPANIFFGTGIPTIIMVLRKVRDHSDVLIVDASKGFEKVGKSNQLRASDIKKIVDVVINREEVDKFSRKVSIEEIRSNDYNLNIPRYVDSSENSETWDIYASMFGGIPKAELNELEVFWRAFPNLKTALFIDDKTPYVTLGVDNIKNAVTEHRDVKNFIENFNRAFADFPRYLKQEFIEKMTTLNISQEEAILTDEIFSRLQSISLVDKYESYQLLDNEWSKIAVDLEIIQTEGFEATKKVNPNMVVKKKDGKEQEVQEGWIGHVLSFELVQNIILKDETNMLKQKENRLLEITAEFEEMLESLTEEEKETTKALNEDNTAFVSAELNEEVKKIYAEFENDEIIALNGYMELLDAKAKKAEKEDYVKHHPQVSWSKIEPNKDGTYAKAKVSAYIRELQSDVTFTEDTLEAKLIRVNNLFVEEKGLKTEVKQASNELHLLTKETIEKLTDKQVLELLEEKWIHPLTLAIHSLPEAMIKDLVTKIQHLADKYAVTYLDVATQIKEAEISLSDLIDEIEGNEFDMKGLREFQSLLKGE